MAIVARTRRTGRRAVRLARETFALTNRRRALLRWAAFAAVKPFSSTVSTEVDGIRYFVSTADQSVGRLIFMGTVPDGELFGRFIALLEREVGRPLLAGNVFVEVGANIGTTTLPAVLRHDARQVLALEPAPDNLPLLRANLAANGLDEHRVRVLPVAASDQPGEAEFEVCSGNSGDGRVRVPAGGGSDPDLYGENRRPVVRVPVARLDDVLAAERIDPDRVGLVWIDTQGHEAQVLGGAPGLLTSAAAVVLEYWPYGLRRAGGLERLHELIAGSGRRIVDLRASVGAGTPVEIPSDELDSLPRRYVEQSYTDLALLSPS
jgi:FkbM family methyltransferase